MLELLAELELFVLGDVGLDVQSASEQGSRI
jgi:hypothetical protein